MEKDMLSRREWLSLTMATGAAVASIAHGCRRSKPLITRAVPAGGERLPIVGLGSSATFSQVLAPGRHGRQRSLKALVDGGGTVFDTAPGYARAEEVSGRVLNAFAHDKFLGDQGERRRRGGGGGGAIRRPRVANRYVVCAVEEGQDRSDSSPNLGDVPTQLAILKELKHRPIR